MKQTHLIKLDGTPDLVDPVIQITANHTQPLYIQCMPLFLKKIIWLITDKCSACGGKVEAYSWKKAICSQCGRTN